MQESSPTSTKEEDHGFKIEEVSVPPPEPIIPSCGFLANPALSDVTLVFISKRRITSYRAHWVLLAGLSFFFDRKLKEGAERSASYGPSGVPWWDPRGDLHQTLVIEPPDRAVESEALFKDMLSYIYLAPAIILTDRPPRLTQNLHLGSIVILVRMWFMAKRYGIPRLQGDLETELRLQNTFTRMARKAEEENVIPDELFGAAKLFYSRTVEVGTRRGVLLTRFLLLVARIWGDLRKDCLLKKTVSGVPIVEKGSGTGNRGLGSAGDDPHLYCPQMAQFFRPRKNCSISGLGGFESGFWIPRSRGL
jgi:hypothetical protein